MNAPNNCNAILSNVDRVCVYETPPAVYLDWVTRANAFFDGPEWGQVLEAGFSARRYYIWDDRHGIGHSLTVFAKGPFRLGYLGFPVCCATGMTTNQYPIERMAAAVSVMQHKPQLLRIAVSAFDQQRLDAHNASIDLTIESCITELATWRADATSTRRRDVRRAKQHCVRMTLHSTATGVELFNVYAEAVRRNHGGLRYGRNYFNAIASMPLSPWVRLVAVRDESELVCMVITIRHGDTTYYLHGGALPEALRSGATDLALMQAIERAQEEGSVRFNFLMSPSNQPGLVRFKEKWGGLSREASTYTLPINHTGRILARLLQRPAQTRS